MARYLHYYENQEDFESEYKGVNYEEPWTSYVKGMNSVVTYDREGYDELKKIPLTFEILENGFIYVYYDGETEDYIRQIGWSINGGQRHYDTADGSYAIEIEVQEGDEVQFFGDCDWMSYMDGSSYEYYTYFGSDCNFKVKGNIMSLFNEDEFENMTEFPDPEVRCVLSHLFQSCDNLVDAYDLVLPVITLTDRCYSYMFYDSGIGRGPDLPTNSVQGIYSCLSMFYGCHALTKAPSLPSKILNIGCYSSMFMHCSSLKTTSKLPASVLESGCYEYMFANCTSLVTTPELPAKTISANCYHAMFSGCTSLTVSPELPATVLGSGCYMRMFAKCTKLSTAPELNANIVESSSYDEMFSGCTSLSYIKCLATYVYSNGLRNWVKGVASSGTFVKRSSMSFDDGDSGIPNNWTVINV